MSAHYYISPVRLTTYARGQHHLQIMEENDGKQTCIALVPYHPYHKDGLILAQKDAILITTALNAVTKLNGIESDAPAERR